MAIEDESKAKADRGPNGLKRLIPRRRGTRRRDKPGSSPGQIIVQPEAPKPEIHLMSYSTAGAVEKKIESIDELKNLDPSKLHWVNVDGLGDAEVIRKFGEVFEFHALAMEDVVSTQSQRPKIEEYDNYLFIVARMPVLRPGVKFPPFESEQLSIFLFENIVVTFQEVPGGDPFTGVRERIRKAKGKICARGGDYLVYAILDAAIDSYFPVIDDLSQEIESVEDEIFHSPRPAAVSRIHILKQDLMAVRRALWPLREVINSLIRDSSDRVCEETKLFLRDCADHLGQALDLTETYRELCADLRDMYLSNISNKMNEIMKFLTIISTIFIPLTFVVGIYGMNFNTEVSPWNMPELNSYYGYPMVCLAMLLISFGLIQFFKKKGWL